MANKSDHLSAVREIIFRAWSDPSFKSRLLADPRSVMEEIGASVPPEGVEIRVIENAPNEVCFVLPPIPDLGDMSEEDIKELLDQSLLEQFVFPTVLEDS